MITFLGINIIRIYVLLLLVFVGLIYNINIQVHTIIFEIFRMSYNL